MTTPPRQAELHAHIRESSFVIKDLTFLLDQIDRHYYIISTPGESISSEGKIDEESLLKVLSCVQCDQFCCPPLTQCRKGHLYCEDCRTSNNRTCQICKQAVMAAVVEGSSSQQQSDNNIALNKLLSFIALACKHQ